MSRCLWPLRAMLHALALALFAFAPAHSQGLWQDGRFLHRVPFTLTNSNLQGFNAGDVVAATIPWNTFNGLLPEDGSQAVVYYNDEPIPCRVLPMGGSVKVLLALPEGIASGSPTPKTLAGFTLYFAALEAVPLPPLPDGVQAFDFRDGSLHGWKSLQDPASSGQAGSDVRLLNDGDWGLTLMLNTSKYHHPMAFASEMTPVGPATAYTRARTNGGENEIVAFQRFNTQILTDSNFVDYLTGSSVPGVGLTLDGWGSQKIGALCPLGSPEGAAGRIHPGPATLEPGSPYVASTEKDQFIITATPTVAGFTRLYADGWQANMSLPDPAGDPTPGSFEVVRNTSGRVSQQPLPDGVAAMMIYSTTVFLKWMVVVPNPDAELLTTQVGAVEQSSGPGAGRAIIEGVVLMKTGSGITLAPGASVRVLGPGGVTLAETTANSEAAYRAIIAAGPAPAEITVAASGSGVNGSATHTVVEDAFYTVDVLMEYEGVLTGRVTDARGLPLANVAVGRFLDGIDYAITDENGRYTLAVPKQTLPIGAHMDGFAMSGPRWIDTTKAAPVADFVVFPSGPNIIAGRTPTITPNAGDNRAALTDGDLASYWTSGPVAGISKNTPLRISFPMNGATVSGVDVHWKKFPAAWRVEMTLDVTSSNGRNPRTDTRVYYSAGDTNPAETGGYTPADSPDRHVVAVKMAPVVGVKTLSIVVTGVADQDPLSLFEVDVKTPQPTTLADAGAAMRIMAGLQEAPTDLHAFWRWNALNDDSVIDWRDAIELIRDTNREVMPLRVLVINYEPIIESRGNRKVRQIYNWPDPHLNTENHRRDMELASHDYLRIYLHPQYDLDEWPLFVDGTRYTDAEYLQAMATGTWDRGQGDYNAIIRQFDLARRVSVGDVDEVWLQGIPGFGWWETTLAGPNGYWCNSGPVPGDNGTRLFCLTGFNYERGTDVMIHDWGHRAESILGFKASHGWNATNGNTHFDHFSRYDQITPGRASLGNCHTPPNGEAGYDYGNTRFVTSDADDWFNFPNFTGVTRSINREAWKTPHAGDYHRNFLIWWFQHMPHFPGTTLDPGLNEQRQMNWWKYIADFNSYVETR